MLTGYGSIATAVESVRAGATTYLTKPVDADQILAAFDETRDREPGAAGRPPSLARVEWEHIQRVLADCDGNVSQARACSAFTGARFSGSSRNTRCVKREYDPRDPPAQNARLKPSRYTTRLPDPPDYPITRLPDYPTI